MEDLPLLQEENKEYKKAAALSQLVIFMRQQHLPLSTQQQTSQKAARGGCESRAGPWDPGQSRALQGGMK